MAVRRLSIELDLDASKFTASIKTATGDTELFSKSVADTDKSIKNIEKSVTGTGARIRDLTVTLAAARYAIESMRTFVLSWAGALVKTSAELERTTFLLSGMSKELTNVGRAKDAANNLQYILDLAKSAPYSIQALSGAFVKLKSGGLDPADGSLRALTDAVAAFGGSEQQLDHAAVAIQQMAGKGVVSMEELRQQLGEAVPNAINMMAMGMGLSMSELVKKVSTGTVQAKDAIGKMMAMFELTFGGSAQRMMETFNGKVSQAKTGLMEFAMVATGLNKDGTTQAGGFFDTLKDAITDFTVALQSPELKQFGVDLGNGLKTSVQAIQGFIGAVGSINRVIPLVDALTAAFKVLAAMMAINLARSAVTSMMGALAGVRTTLTAMSAAVKLAAADFGVLTFAVKEATMAKGQWAATAGIASTAMRSLGAAVAASIGPISVIATVILTAADAFGLFKNKAKEAQKALDDFNRTGFASPEGIKQVNDGLKDAQGRLNAVNNQIKNATGPNDPYLAGFNQRKAAIEAEIAMLKERKSLMETSLTQSNGQMRGDTQVRQWEQNDQRYQQITAARRQAQLDYDKVFSDEKTTDAQRNAAKSAFIDEQKKLDQKEVSLLSNQITAATAYRNSLKKGTEEEAAANVSIQKLIDQRSELLDRQGRVYSHLEAPNVYVAGQNGDKATKAAINAALDKLAQMRSQAAGIRAQIENDGEKGATEVAKMASMLDPTTGDKGLLKAVAASKGLRDQLMGAAAMLDELKAKSDGLKAFNGLEEERDKQVKTVEGLRKELDAVLTSTEETITANARYRAGLDDNVKSAERFSKAAGTVADEAARAQREGQQLTASIKAVSDISREVKSAQDQANSAFDDLNSGSLTANLTMLRYQKTMEKMVEQVMPQYRAQARAMADEAISAFGQFQSAQAAMDMRQQTRDINRELMGDGVSMARDALQEQIDVMYERVQWDKLTADQRKDIEKDYWAFVQAQQRKFAQDGGNPLRKMATDWSHTTENMRQASANWMDSFVNQLADGKLNFADFAKSLLGDILKIILRAMIAQMILAAIGAAGPVAPMSAMENPSVVLGNTGIAGGNVDMITTANLPHFHTGGIVDAFKDAFRYHTGGLAGLKPDEVPAILQHGEGVFTKEQMAAMGGASAPPSVSVNVINESGVAMDAQQKGGPRFDGRGYVLDIVIDAASKPGKMRDALRGVSRT